MLCRNLSNTKNLPCKMLSSRSKQYNMANRTIEGCEFHVTKQQNFQSNILYFILLAAEHANETKLKRIIFSTVVGSSVEIVVEKTRSSEFLDLQI